MAALTSVTGNVDISGNTSATTIDMSALTTVTGNVDISGNTSFGEVDLSSLTSVGEVTISDNTSATAIDMTALTSVTGNVDISGNTSFGEVDLSSLTSVGEVTISDNTSATAIDMTALTTVTGNVDISGNTSVGEVDLSSLGSVGEVTISDNGPATTVNMASNVTVVGNVTIETTGSGTFDMSSAAVGGDTSLTTDGYTEVDAATAAGQTSVTMLNNAAKMEVTLPDGTFSEATDPVTFSIERLPGSVETIGDDTITHLATYAFDFEIQTLDLDATLNFEIDLVMLDEPARLSLLDLLDAGAELTLGVRGDAPGAELQLFDVCAPGTEPVADECVVVQWLDETRMLLDPLSGMDPSILRLEGKVGHFSTYSFVAVVGPPAAGDFDEDGDVDGHDFLVWQRNPSVGNLADWQANFGVDPLVAANAAVPEPATPLMLFMGMLVIYRRPRRTVS